MHSITVTSGRQFEARADESLLDAALRQGLVLDHSCRTGRCNTCKGRVLSGSTEPLHEELGLSAADKAHGFILTCVRKALGALQLEVDDLGDVAIPESKTLPARIHSLTRLSDDVMHVVLRLPPATPLGFLPGQYIDVIGPEGIRRSYSLANAPRADKLVELHIREVPDGAMSHYWFEQAKPKDLLRLRGPLGTFFLRGQQGKHLVFLATGTGIAPVKAILEGIETLSASEQPRSVTVYWGGRHARDLYWQPVTDAQFRFVPVLSRAEPSWTGERGHVQRVLLAHRPDLVNTVVYACGSDAMIHDAQAALTAAGLPERQFHSDAFVCSAAT